MKCPWCGAGVEEGADLCLECGEPMGESPAAKVARGETVIRPPADAFGSPMRRPFLVLLVLAGCSSPSKPSAEMLPELKAILEAKPANGYQVIMPIVKDLQPGADSEICTWTDIVVDHDVDVRAVQAFQT